MTVSEIFSKISAHQVEGLMLHNDMADYFDFLGLMGFKRMHEYQFLSEGAEMRGIHRYFINHYNMLIPEDEVSAKSNIPQNWRNYTRQQVDGNTKRNAVETATKKWVEWEKLTKELYQMCYKELCEIGEIAAAMKVKELICDVDGELKCADRLHIKLTTINYDLPTIIIMQDDLHEEYKEKEKHIGIDIC